MGKNLRHIACWATGWLTGLALLAVPAAATPLPWAHAEAWDRGVEPTIRQLQPLTVLAPPLALNPRDATFALFEKTPQPIDARLTQFTGMLIFDTLGQNQSVGQQPIDLPPWHPPLYVARLQYAETAVPPVTRLIELEAQDHILPTLLHIMAVESEQIVQLGSSLREPEPLPRLSRRTVLILMLGFSVVCLTAGIATVLVTLRLLRRQRERSQMNLGIGGTDLQQAG